MNHTPPTPVTDMDDEERVAYLAAVREGREDIKAGRFVPYEKVRRWLLSWGTDQELPPPECP
jgi:predicted transcriptional regulator